MSTRLEVISDLRRTGNTRVVLLVMDGLGGLPVDPGGPTELESASTPNLDALAERGICGLHEAVGTGITPGSGPGHLALFGYDPLRYRVGRGVLSALGADFDLTQRDVAARGNFCTVDDSGRVTDRRAGRIATEKNRELVERLRQIDVPGIELFVQTVKEHRFLLVLRGDNLSDAVCDTDPQHVGTAPVNACATVESKSASRTAESVQQFARQARDHLRDALPANMVLLRGFAKRPDWPAFPDVFGFRAAALADYPMYRGVAKLVGMQPVECGGSLDDKIDQARRQWDDYDFFFIHHKNTDSRGEDSDFDAKAQEIERVDAALPRLLDLRPDVVIVTGDHSTPAALGAHSWHPVPLVLWSTRCRPDRVERFGEHDCIAGGLGARLPASDLMPLAAAHAGRLEKFGA